MVGGYDNKIDVRHDVLEYMEQELRKDPHHTIADLTVSEELSRDENDSKWIISEMKLMAEDNLLEKTDVAGSLAFYKITSKGVNALETTYNFEFQDSRNRLKRHQELEKYTEKQRKEFREEKKHDEMIQITKESNKWNRVGIIIAGVVGFAGLMVAIFK